MLVNGELYQKTATAQKNSDPNTISIQTQNYMKVKCKERSKLNKVNDVYGEN